MSGILLVKRTKLYGTQATPPGEDLSCIFDAGCLPGEGRSGIGMAWLSKTRKGEKE